MAVYMARVARALIVSMFGFGGGTGLLVFIAAIIFQDKLAVQHALSVAIAFGLIFAFLLVAVLMPLDLSAHLFLSKGSRREIWELEQRRDLLFEGNLKDLANYCREALLAVPYVKNVTEDMEHLLIRAAAGVSFRSAGELIEVEINPRAEQKWQVRCTSKPVSASIVFDYGKNFENVEIWLSGMLSLTGKRGQQA